MVLTNVKHEACTGSALAMLQGCLLVPERTKQLYSMQIYLDLACLL